MRELEKNCARERVGTQLLKYFMLLFVNVEQLGSLQTVAGKRSNGHLSALHSQTLPHAQQQLVGDGSLDIHGQPSNKATSGRWKAAYVIMGG